MKKVLATIKKPSYIRFIKTARQQNKRSPRTNMVLSRGCFERKEMYHVQYQQPARHRRRRCRHRGCHRRHRRRRLLLRQHRGSERHRYRDRLDPQQPDRQGRRARRRTDPGCVGEEVGDPGLHHLPRRRQEAEDAEASSEVHLQHDARRVPCEVGSAERLPDGRPELRQAAVGSGEADRSGHEAPHRGGRRLIGTVIDLIKGGHLAPLFSFVSFVDSKNILNHRMPFDILVIETNDRYSIAVIVKSANKIAKTVWTMMVRLIEITSYDHF